MCQVQFSQQSTQWTCQKISNHSPSSPSQDTKKQSREHLQSKSLSALGIGGTGEGIRLKQIQTVRSIIGSVSYYSGVEKLVLIRQIELQL